MLVDVELAHIDDEVALKAANDVELLVVVLLPVVDEVVELEDVLLDVVEAEVVVGVVLDVLVDAEDVVVMLDVVVDLVLREDDEVACGRRTC